MVKPANALTAAASEALCSTVKNDSTISVSKLKREFRKFG